MNRCLCIFFLLLFSICSYAGDSATFNKKYVIYITLDGVRWQDVFLDHSHFKKFWEMHAQHAAIYGAPGSHTTMEVASIPVSLPSYQSQLSGTVQPCPGNDCGRIMVETFPENLKQQLNLKKNDIAIFGSWYHIAHSVEHIEGTVVTNTGNTAMTDPDTGIPDLVMMLINDKQRIDMPDDEYTRYDKYTFAHAMHYFENYRPRFLWIALNDSDEYAHANDLNGYHTTLSFYDDVLDFIFKKIKLLHLEQETMVIVTTDHGRNDDWTGHGNPESKQTWAFVMNGALIPISESNGILEYNTLSIRPTVERAMIGKLAF